MNIRQIRQLAIYLLFFFVLNIAGYFFYIQNTRPQKTTRHFESRDIPGIKYVFSPLNMDSFLSKTILASPSVSIRPSSPKYILVLLKETKDINSNNYSRIFFASKRVKELEQWGNKMKTLRNYENIEQLTRWWKEGQFKPLKYSNYNTWEGGLARYTIILEKELSDLETRTHNTSTTTLVLDSLRTEKIIEIKTALKQHEKDLTDAIQNSTLSQEEKTYRQRITKEVFENLTTRFKKNILIYDDIDTYDPFTLYYVLNEININKQQGQYLFSMDPESSSDFIVEKQGLTLDEKPISPDTIVVINGQTKLKIKIPQVNVLDKSIWKKSYDKIAKKYTYSTTFFHKGTITKYYIPPLHSSKGELLLTIEDTKKNIIYKKTIHQGESPNIEHLILSPKSQLLKIVIRSVVALPANQDPFKLFLIQEPDLVFTKLSSITPPKNIITTHKRSPHFFSSNFFKRLLIVDIVLFIGFLIYSNLQTILSSFFRYDLLRKNSQFMKYIHKIAHKFRVLLLGITVFALLISIFSQTVFPERNTYFITISIILTILAYSMSSTIVLILSLSLLSLLIPFSVIHNDVIVDKLASWSFIFAAIGATLLMKEITSETVSLNGWEELHRIVGHEIQWFIKKIKYVSYILFITFIPSQTIRQKLLQTFSKITKSTLYRTAFTEIKILKNRFFALFIRKPKNIREKLRNFVLTVIFFLSLLIIFNKVANIYNTYLARQRINPSINKIEPHYVYRSSKVVIFGTNLGWTGNNPELKLKNQYGEIPVDEWLDHKIIFSVPLHWKNGELEIWAEKKVLWDGKYIWVKSNVEKIKLIPITDKFTRDDDAYFEDLKHLDKETLRLNGYK